MASSAVRIRYVYETSFYDGRADWSSSPSSSQMDNNPPSSEQVDSAINHPIVRKIQQAVIRARKAVMLTSSSSSSALANSNPNMTAAGHHSMTEQSVQRSPSSSISSSFHQTSMFSLDETGTGQLDDVDGRILLNRSRSLQQTHHLFHSVDSSHHHRGFSLHLSPKQRTKMSETVVLSPISDKSENDATSQMLITPTTSTAGAAAVIHPFEFNSSTVAVRRRPQSLFPSISINSSRPGGSAGGSDSGISISANSLVTHDSHEALQPLHKPPLHLSLDNSHEFLSSSSSCDPPEENLPFLMPKLRRAATNNVVDNNSNNSSVFKPQINGQGLGCPVRQLSLTLPFPPLQSLPFVAPAVGFKDLVDDTIPLDIQSWYHGSITRRDAEKRLRPAPAGSFLVRDSMASHDDYFLAARGENGFLHVRICCNIDSEENDPYYASAASNSKSFTLATLPERHFETVAAAVNHCANIGVYSRHLPPVILKYPLTEESV